MEIRARYVQMGAFTLAVLAAGFAFVYWLNNAGALRERAIYQVRFESPVSGLLAGSAVLFNGIRVGEVTALRSERADARQVLATIAVERNTPVKADTTAGIDFQGLTGSPVIALAGGTSKEALAGAKARVPLLVAEPGAGQSMSQAARDALKRLDGLLAENAQPLQEHACQPRYLLAAARPQFRSARRHRRGPRAHDGRRARLACSLTSSARPRLLTPLDKPLNRAGRVADPTALAALDSDRIQRASPGGPATALPDAQWSDTLPKLLQVKIMRGLEDANAFAGVSRPLEAVTADFQLLVDVRKFRLVSSPAGTAEVDLAGKILDAKGRIVATRVFAESMRVSDEATAAAIAALDRAFAKAGSELIAWAVRTMSDQSNAPKPTVPKKAEIR